MKKENNIVDKNKMIDFMYRTVESYGCGAPYWIVSYQPISEFEPSTGSRVDNKINLCKKELEGKKYIFKNHNDKDVVVDDCVIYAMKKILKEEHRRTSLYRINSDFLGFMVSEYVQNHIKKDLIKRLENNKYDGQLLETLRSDILFNNMSKEEIIMLLEELEKTEDENEKYVTSLNGRSEFIKFYLYKLGGKNIMDALIEKYGIKDFACHILETNGLCGSAGYYWGRGVTKSDLNEIMMVAIYAQLKSFDESLATGYAEVVKEIPLLTASDFITSFYKYFEAYIGAEVNAEPISKEQFFIGLLSSLASKKDDEEIQEISDNMKASFIKSVDPNSKNDEYDDLDDFNYRFR